MTPARFGWLQAFLFAVRVGKLGHESWRIPMTLEAVIRFMAIYTDILKELRKDKKITQEMMARRFGISRVMYGYYETGRRSMPPEMLSILADELGTSTDYILGRTATQAPYPPRVPKERPSAHICHPMAEKKKVGV